MSCVEGSVCELFVSDVLLVILPHLSRTRNIAANIMVDTTTYIAA